MTDQTIPSSETEAAKRLLTAAAVRERSHQLLEAGLAGLLDHFTVDLGKLDSCADEVVKTIREAYPSLDIPFHARWRHFTAGGHPRWEALMEGGPWESHAALARAAFDLAIVSVLLDAGAGPQWRYEEGRTGETFARSEGLAVASFDMFIGGAFSSRPEDPFRVDADVLMGLTVEDLATGFQVGPDNPLVGLEGRVSLLNRLGRVVATNPDIFGQHDDPRPGGLFDVIAATAQNETIKATAILEALLTYLGPIWPGRIKLGGIDLGDTWRHPLVEAPDETRGLIPFHKLSQWLSYSLIEPLEWAGYTVEEVDGLTGLPEYRNGGLFLDSEVIALKNPSDAKFPHTVDSRLVVEWRALTVALLDRIADPIRSKLGFRSEDFPLAKALEGGTWATGRRLAKEKRGDGSPPLTVVSDGTVF
ncbi:URC4/urg3 family protein [Microvirga pudoricolor]|uniref:URC4/urg3 family protein n=1 Tax=Microvirga pudoricolor TaxID=2778729 RepID=UPI00194E61DB|nr:URC4/urg3 family protein [Microvirga pudoricolor]MBM6596187.1 URC4/urg3 family protein [Microvirga pudoricolor]